MLPEHVFSSEGSSCETRLLRTGCRQMLGNGSPGPAHQWTTWRRTLLPPHFTFKVYEGISAVMRCSALHFLIAFPYEMGMLWRLLRLVMPPTYTLSWQLWCHCTINTRFAIQLCKMTHTPLGLKRTTFSLLFSFWHDRLAFAIFKND